MAVEKSIAFVGANCGLPFSFGGCGTNGLDEDQRISEVVKIYPSVASDEQTFMLQSLTNGLWNVKLITFSGIILWSGEIRSNEAFQVSAVIPNGLHIFSVTSRHEQYSTRIIKL